MKKIHLIQKRPDLRPWSAPEGYPVYESGYWALSEKKARSLIGGEIYFYEKRTAPSFLGGVIENIRLKQEDPWKGRIIFTFRSAPEYEGKRTSKDRWGMEKKIES